MERITSPCHITSIQRIFADNSKEQCFYNPVWLDNGKSIQCVNPYQRSKINRHGDLFLAIYADMGLLDSFFPDEQINANDYAVPCLVSVRRQQEV